MPIVSRRSLEYAVDERIWADHFQRVDGFAVTSAYDFHRRNCFGPGPPGQARMSQ